MGPAQSLQGYSGMARYIEPRNRLVPIVR
jgi:hypothetical protein